MEFKVGDKVISSYRNRNKTIGTVIRITEKRGDIVVDFGNFKETYNPNGWQKGRGAWDASTIQLLTPEIEEELRQSAIIRKCHDIFEEKKKDLTADQAERILKILEENSTWKF